MSTPNPVAPEEEYGNEELPKEEVETELEEESI